MILTFAIEETAPYSRAAVVACVAKACEQWSKALAGRVRFQPLADDEDEELADLTFRFGRLDNDAWIAQHKRWGGAGVITFRNSASSGKAHTWAVTGWERFWGLKQYCVLTVAMHELGHALGAPGHLPPGQLGVMTENLGSARYRRPTKADTDFILDHLKP
jgi:hypothetical protein